MCEYVYLKDNCIYKRVTLSLDIFITIFTTSRTYLSVHVVLIISTACGSLPPDISQTKRVVRRLETELSTEQDEFLWDPAGLFIGRHHRLDDQWPLSGKVCVIHHALDKLAAANFFQWHSLPSHKLDEVISSPHFCLCFVSCGVVPRATADLPQRQPKLRSVRNQSKCWRNASRAHFSPWLIIPFREADSRSAGQGVPRTVLNPNGNYGVLRCRHWNPEPV
jgi:hypothetical protein